MSLANYFSRDFWSAFDLKSNLPHSIDSLFSLLLISKLLIQMHVLFLLELCLVILGFSLD